MPRRRNLTRSAKPSNKFVNSSMALGSDSRGEMYASEDQNGTIKELNSRKRENGKLMNPDGTEMTYESYMQIVKAMEEGGDNA